MQIKTIQEVHGGEEFANYWPYPTLSFFPPRIGNLPGSHSRLEESRVRVTLSFLGQCLWAPTLYFSVPCPLNLSLLLDFPDITGCCREAVHTQRKGDPEVPQEKKSWRLATPTAQTMMRHASVLGKDLESRAPTKGQWGRLMEVAEREVHRSRRKIKWLCFLEARLPY